MAHQEDREFMLSVRAKFPTFFADADVLDIGSLDINGSNRELFTGGSYTGIDLGPGKNVDIVCHCADFKPGKQYDAIISSQAFEHDARLRETLWRIVQLLRHGGLFAFACATTGRPEHGTGVSDGNYAAPFCGDFYHNVTEKECREILNFDLTFYPHEFRVNEASFDLFFWGIKV